MSGCQIQKATRKCFHLVLKLVYFKLVFNIYYTVMEDYPKICRICLQITSKFELLNDHKFEMLKKLLVNLDNFVSQNLSICSECYSDLQQSFEFKLRCLDKNEYIISNYNSRMPINLETISTSPYIPGNGIHLDELHICRFCLNYNVMDKLISLQNLETDIFLKDIINRCLPEIDFTLNDYLSVCFDCMDSLQLYFNFLVRCCDSDEIINFYVMKNPVEGINPSTIDLFNVAQYVTELKNTNSDLEYLKVEGNTKEILNIKQEEMENYSLISKSQCDIDHDMGLETKIKIETNLAIKEDSSIIKKEVELENNHLKSDKCEVRRKLGIFTEDFYYRMIATDIISCPHCAHRTTRKANMDLHLIVHQKHTEVVMHKCTWCNFQTKWKTSLQSHLQHLHNPKDALPSYECANCSYKSLYKKHLIRHMKRHNSKAYSCDLCSFGSNLMRDLKKHYKTEHNIKALNIIKKANAEQKSSTNAFVHSYICPECQYETKRKHRLKEHFLKHRNKDEVIMHNCKLCNFTSKYKDSVRHHMKVHKKNKSADNIEQNASGSN